MIMKAENTLKDMMKNAASILMYMTAKTYLKMQGIHKIRYIAHYMVIITLKFL